MILVTGGAGFIGSHFVRDWLAQSDEPLINLDALTYAGCLESLGAARADPRHHFIEGDIGNRVLVDELLALHRPRAVVHLAAETHVDRSIHDPGAFVRTNVAGSATLLEAVRAYWSPLPAAQRAAFRLLHVSTDEIYGSLGPLEPPCDETRAAAPNNPYAASKAASDHLVRAWHHTYGLPVITTRCSNNFGPWQFPEKLIPVVISHAKAGEPVPLYGDGAQVRDWLHVQDHCEALRTVLDRGRVGEVYHVGGGNECRNLDVARSICALLDELAPSGAGAHARLIAQVNDRAGHDRRYALDTRKIERELGWRPRHGFDAALRETVQWVLDHPSWMHAAQRRKAGPR
jgi:dTDP-glucose 4,6-dehydratase